MFVFHTQHKSYLSMKFRTTILSHIWATVEILFDFVVYRLYRMYRLFYRNFYKNITGMRTGCRIGCIEFVSTGIRMDGFHRCIDFWKKFYTCLKAAWLLGLQAFFPNTCIDFKNKVYTAQTRMVTGFSDICIESIDFFQTTYIYILKLRGVIILYNIWALKIFLKGDLKKFYTFYT